MDHPCHKCGRSTEDGKPFCAQCGAPQIRVAVPEPTLTAGLPSNDLPVFLDQPLASRPLSAPALSSRIDWSRAFKASAVAGLIAFLVTVLRLMVPPLAMLGSGFLAVILYRRWNPGWRSNAVAGAQLGALSGLVFSGISALSVALAAALWQNPEVRQGMQEALQQLAARSNDPQVQAALDLLKTPEGLIGKVALGVIVLLLVSVAAGSISGALTGALSGRKNRP